ncbi:hypothetical protein VAC51_00028 [Variovorax phage VAC_51]|uniref:Uncharacterized protein n=1 Tax=Variovorax phage VAC_51 TaxID=2985242 RepID=A0A9N6WTY3_9CAUD|nr:hypothetical protein VAC51_00028 [Variovorax phage VAC_51]
MKHWPWGTIAVVAAFSVPYGVIVFEAIVYITR